MFDEFAHTVGFKVGLKAVTSADCPETREPRRLQSAWPRLLGTFLIMVTGYNYIPPKPVFWLGLRAGGLGLRLFVASRVTLSQLGLARRGLCVRVTTESTTLLCFQCYTTSFSEPGCLQKGFRDSGSGVADLGFRDSSGLGYGRAGEGFSVAQLSHNCPLHNKSDI